MSSRSSSKADQTSTQQDNKVNADGGSTVVSGAGGAVTINQADMGLITEAFDYFASKDAYAAAAQEKIIDTAAAGFESIMSAGSSLLNKAAATADKTIPVATQLLNAASAAADPATMQKRFEMMLLALGAVFLFMQYNQKRA